MNRILNTIKKILPKKVFKAIQPAYHFLFSALAALFYRFPSNRLIVIGVTGTTGKTTITYFIKEMLQNAGYKVGCTSTALFNDGENEWLNDKKMTMVGRFFTQRMMRKMVKNGCQYAIIETTSEGVVQYRHRFINYDILIMTGLYPEHIDSHGGFEKYREAKGRLFLHLKKCKAKYADDDHNIKHNLTAFKKIDLTKVKKEVIINGDDENAEYFMDFWAEERIFITKREDVDTCSYADIRNEKNLNKIDKIVTYGQISNEASGLSFSFIPSLKFFSADKQTEREKITINSRLIGDFNAINLLFAASVGLARGVDTKKIKDGLENISGVAGRLERISEGQNFSIIVDYAFEPNALTKLYDAISTIDHNRIIHVLGSAGGGRDVARRPRLGAIAGEKADFVIITNEDPYDDDPEVIINQVAAGAENAKKRIGENLFKISNRREAIRRALALADENDIVLITGKGSEQAICVANGEKIAWDDREVTREELKKLL